MTEEKIASLVNAMLVEFQNDFVLAAVLQPQKDTPVWKVVLTRHKEQTQEPLTIAIDLHSGDSQECIKAAVHREILQAIDGDVAGYS